MKAFVLLLVAFVFYGCGGMTNATQNVKFDADVPGVKVTVNNSMSCNTPCAMDFKTDKKSLMVKAEKEGYKTASAIMGTSVSGSVAALDILGGIMIIPAGTTSTTVDISTGHMYEYSPGNFFFTMNKDDGTNIADTSVSTFYWANIDKLRAEAAQGGGENIDTLVVLMDADKKTVVKTIKSISNDKDLFDVLVSLKSTGTVTKTEPAKEKPDRPE